MNLYAKRIHNLYLWSKKMRESSVNTMPSWLLLILSIQIILIQHLSDFMQYKKYSSKYLIEQTFRSALWIPSINLGWPLVVWSKEIGCKYQTYVKQEDQQYFKYSVNLVSVAFDWCFGQQIFFFFFFFFLFTSWENIQTHVSNPLPRISSRMWIGPIWPKLLKKQRTNTFQVVRLG